MPATSMDATILRQAMLHELAPWPVVDQQASRGPRADCFEMLTHDRRAVLQLAAGRGDGPTVSLEILDAATQVAEATKVAVLVMIGRAGAG